MEIDYNINAFSVFEEVTLATALEHMNTNGSQIVFTVDQLGKLTGVLSDGDFRRWLLANGNVNTSQPVSFVARRSVVTARIDGRAEDWEALFSDRIRILPLIDADRRLRAIVRPRKQVVRIGQRRIGTDTPVFIVAEIGNNHNGSIDRARQLVDAAAAAGVDCAKFQMRQLRSIYRFDKSPEESADDLGVEYTLDLLSRYALSNDDLFRMFDYCRARGIEPLCTPWDVDSVAILESYGVNGYKIASPDLTNHDLLRRVAETRKAMLVSTGMSSEHEIRQSARLLQEHSASFALLHCNSTYPAPFRDINLAYMDRLREIGHCPVGYSGHERGIHVAVAAVARGAKVIEKHFTLDRALTGSDHKISLLPDELRQMVAGIRQTEAAIGSPDPRNPSQGELLNRSTLAKSLVARRDIAPGEVITGDLLDVKSPGQGLQPNNRAQVVGRRARRRIVANQPIFSHDIDDPVAAARHYRFTRPWGIPVRYHDWRKLTAMSNPDFVEFHLSYRDLDVAFRDFLESDMPFGFLVHCPELFADDHILDLCAPDEAYRRRSLDELARVLDLTRDLKAVFPGTARPGVVVNLGGFSEDGHLEGDAAARRYDILEESLDALDTAGVEILPQTMPPFPWHFGGQRFHNVFVDPDEIVPLCARRGLRVCLDVSHAMLACTRLRMPLEDYIARLAPHVAHLHIADASGADREGLQIGDGTINFASLARQLNHLAPEAGFIPEIWQGHVDGGSGFWTALERLEPLFQTAQPADAGRHRPHARRAGRARRALRATRGTRSRIKQ